MFKIYIPSSIINIIRISVLLIFIVTIFFFQKYTLKEIIIIFILICTSLISYTYSDNLILFELLILGIGLKNVLFSKIVKCFFTVTASVMSIATISALIGIIENRQFIRKDSGIVRYALGAIYPTDYAALIFFILIAFGYLTYKRFSLLYLSIYCVIGGLIYALCNARIDAFCIILSGFVFYLLPKFEKNIKGIFKKLISYFMVISSIFIIYLSASYNSNSELYLVIDKVFSTRLKLGHKAFQLYNVNLFGNVIEMQGWGVLNFDYTKGYFFLDSSYMNILFQYGIISLIVILVVYTLKTRQLLDNENYIIPIIVVLISFNSIFAHHLLGVAFNPFLFIFLTKTNNKTKLEKFNN